MPIIVRRIYRVACASVALLLVSCAAQPDQFYTLNTLPEESRGPAAALTTRVILGVTVPSAVDRREMVIDAGADRVLMLEHQRWAAPLADEVSQTLARDIERRRADVIVGDRGFAPAHTTPVKIKVDVVQMSARMGGRAILEAHWQIVDAASEVDEIGGDVFSAPLDGDGYAAVARAFSVCLSQVADRLAEKLPLNSGAPPPAAR
jgi:uncharacterized lipoprotein YmbA